MKKVGAIVIIIFILIVVGLRAKYLYFDIYKLSLSGKVVSKRHTVQENLVIIVNERSYDLSHFWPTLDSNLAVGDSIYKESGKNSITLIKSSTGEKIICEKK